MTRRLLLSVDAKSSGAMSGPIHGVWISVAARGSVPMRIARLLKEVVKGSPDDGVAVIWRAA